MNTAQVAALMLLRDGPMPGLHLRAELRSHGIRKNGPAFYAMMAKLEDANYVAGRYIIKNIGSDTVKSRTFTLTTEGREAYDDFIRKEIGP